MRKTLRAFWAAVAAAALAASAARAQQPSGQAGVEGVARVLAETPPEFVLGPGDQLRIEVWKLEELTREVAVDARGEFYFPLLGYVRAQGQTLRGLQQTLQEGLRPYYHEPQVGVQAAVLRSQKVFVLGQVRTPGIYPALPEPSALEAVALAGGFTPEASLRHVVLVRGNLEKPELRKLNLRAVVRKGDLRDNLQLRGGDILYVPAGPVANINKFFVMLQNIVLPFVLVDRRVGFLPRTSD